MRVSETDAVAARPDNQSGARSVKRLWPAGHITWASSARVCDIPVNYLPFWLLRSRDCNPEKVLCQKLRSGDTVVSDSSAQLEKFIEQSHGRRRH